MLAGYEHPVPSEQANPSRAKEIQMARELHTRKQRASTITDEIYSPVLGGDEASLDIDDSGDDMESSI